MRRVLAGIRGWVELAALLLALQIVVIIFVVTTTADLRFGAIAAAIGLFFLARSLIAGKIRRARRKRGLCIPCGYDLAGNVSGICPECGAKVG
ncbi:MAG: hypothetical protein JWN51_1286 [Phycisphaerales bacterium]|nr:hypothetical protein [Phycisphaerales bacterium]